MTSADELARAYMQHNFRKRNEDIKELSLFDAARYLEHLFKLAKWKTSLVSKDNKTMMMELQKTGANDIERLFILVPREVWEPAIRQDIADHVHQMGLIRALFDQHLDKYLPQRVLRALKSV